MVWVRKAGSARASSVVTRHIFPGFIAWSFDIFFHAISDLEQQMPVVGEKGGISRAASAPGACSESVVQCKHSHSTLWGLWVHVYSRLLV